MHVVVGFLIVAASFALTLRFSGQAFNGFFNTPSAILLAGVPIGLVIVTYPFSAIGDALRGIAWSIFRDLAGEQRRTRERLRDLARAVRGGRGQQALETLRGSRDAVLVALGERAVRQVSPEDIAQDGTALARAELERYQGAEKLFGSLGEYAPGAGMIGTVIGLVQLLANMSDLDTLGPAMALALITTLYGLVLAHALYLPLSRLAASQAERRANDLNLVITCMKKIAQKRPIYEVDQLLGLPSDPNEGTPVRSEAQ
jgi:chemotaxis protein MotA